MELFINHLSEDIYYKDIHEIFGDSVYIDTVSVFLPNNYKIVTSGIYTNCINPDIFLPIQGWKIHISSNIMNANEILLVVSRLANEFKFSFKFMSNEQILCFSTQKNYSRSQAGKFVTIYTRDEEEFVEVIERLYIEFRTYDGPFVLTDRRYKDCKVLYYRYGAFDMMYGFGKSSDTLGILSPYGQFIEDKREVSYCQPEFVLLPFVEEKIVVENTSYLFNMYSDIEALYFSNSGGVYLAKYGEDTQVVLKESRPFTCISSNGIQDSIDRRKQEAEFLKKFSDVVQFPKLYDSFYEWEHYFIVEEYILGETLKEFSAANNPFLNQANQTKKDKLLAYIKRIISIVGETMEVLEIVHNAGYVLGDLSLDNIMISNGGTLKFIDLESVFYNDSIPEDILLTYSTNYKDRKNIFSIDFEMLGHVFYDLIFPKSALRSFGEDYLSRYLLSIINDFGLTRKIYCLWRALIHFDSHQNYKIIKKILKEIQKSPLTTNLLSTNRMLDFSLRLADCVSEQTTLLEEFIIKDLKIYANYGNNLSLGTGVAGTILCLQTVSVDKKLLNRYEEWLMSSFLRHHKRDVGLMNGDSGIALSLLKNKPKFSQAIVSNLNSGLIITGESDFSYANGLSGYGMLLLKMWEKFQYNEYLLNACHIGDKMLENSDVLLGELRLGLMDGQLGVSLFLLYLYIASKDIKYLQFGDRLINNVLKHKMVVNDNIGIPNSKESTIVLPYLGDGSSGLVGVLLRYYIVTQNPCYKVEMEQLIQSIRIKYSISPGIIDGLAGIGHVFIDLYRFAGKDEYLDVISDIKDGLLLQLVKKKGKHFFPNLKMEKLDASFMFGISGILTFFNRIEHKIGETPFFFCDSLLESVYIKKRS